MAWYFGTLRVKSGSRSWNSFIIVMSESTVALKPVSKSREVIDIQERNGSFLGGFFKSLSDTMEISGWAQFTFQEFVGFQCPLRHAVEAFLDQRSKGIHGKYGKQAAKRTKVLQVIQLSSELDEVSHGNFFVLWKCLVWTVVAANSPLKTRSTLRPSR